MDSTEKRTLISRLVECRLETMSTLDDMVKDALSPGADHLQKLILENEGLSAVLSLLDFLVKNSGDFAFLLSHQCLELLSVEQAAAVRAVRMVEKPHAALGELLAAYSAWKG